MKHTSRQYEHRIQREKYYDIASNIIVAYTFQWYHQYLVGTCPLERAHFTDISLMRNMYITKS